MNKLVKSSLRSAVLAVLFVPGLQGQGRTAILSVVDAAGVPVPYAVVTVGKSTARVADDSGRIAVPPPNGDSLRIRVRRMGYREFCGALSQSADDKYVVSLTALSPTLTEVTIRERTLTPLANRGFYDRVDRVQNGAIVGEFLTPEDLDAMNQSTLTGMLRHSRHARISRTRPGNGFGQNIILGRGRCAMNIVVDGQLLTGTAQDDILAEAPTSINPGGSRRRSAGGTGPEVDRLIDGRSIMAIEIYPSSANAPAEVIPFGGDGACGIVAIWTGARR